MAGMGRSELRRLIEEKNLIVNYKDLEEQLTANGIDVRVGAIIEVLEAGEVGLSKKENVPPKLGTAYVMKGREYLLDGVDAPHIKVVDEGEKIELQSLKPYLVVTIEEVNTPPDLFFKIEIRSTLFRYGQMILETSFGEAGYKGKLTFLLLPLLKTKLSLGSRIAQISFYALSSEGDYTSQKEFSYQHGRIL